MLCQTANIEERLGKFFKIQIKSRPNLILEIKDPQCLPSTPIVLGELSSEDDAADHQLWFVDATTFTLRSKFNSFCICFNAQEDLIVQPYMTGKSQQWIIREDGTITERDFDNVITVKSDMLVPGTECHMASYEGSSGQLWSLDYLPATYFFIRHCETDKVLDIRGDLAMVGAQVITYVLKDPPSDNQLWYEDQNGVIHSKLNDYILNVVDMDVLMYPYNSEAVKQEWVINGSLIQDRLRPSCVLDVRQALLQSFGTVIATEYTLQDSQHWSYQAAPSNPYVYDHNGKGKYFLIRHSYFGVNLTIDIQTPPCPVLLAKTQLHPNGLFKENQSFFYDHIYGVIRSKVNERLCLEDHGSNLMLSTHQSNNCSQQLEFKDGKICHKKGSTTVLTLGTTEEEHDPATMQCYFSEDIDSHHQEWTLIHATAQCFFIETKVGNKVLEARREAGNPICNVVLGDRKPQTRNATQLWYEDETGILRSKLNGYVLDFSYGKLHTDRYNPVNPHQGWVIFKECIRNRNSGLLLDTSTQKKWFGSSIGPSENKSTDSQKWRFLYV